MATSKIPSGIETTTATAAEGITLSINKVMKDGNVLRFRLATTTALPSQTYTHIATLPEGFRPRTNVIKAIMLTEARAGYIRVYSNGEVQVYSASAATVALYIDETLLML